MIEKNVNQKLLGEDASAKILVDLIDENETTLNLSDSILYHKFLLYTSSDDITVVARVMIVSKRYGVLIFHCTEQTERTLSRENIQILREELAQINSFVYSELLKSRMLQISPTTLRINVVPIFFLPFYMGDINVFIEGWEGLHVIQNPQQLANILTPLALDVSLEENTIREIVAILEGSKGIIRPKERAKNVQVRNKGKILDLIESEIANFDLDQNRAALFTLDDPQRIRGLAGTGKTVILTMKAALIHLQHPEADVLRLGVAIDMTLIPSPQQAA
jgi:superfamily I DNA and RNA helicase